MAFVKLTIWRSFLALATIFVTITVSFFLMRLAPGGPFDQERRLAPEVIANLNAKYNLDKPLLQQFYIYIKGLLHGDFGPSMIYPDLSVSDLVFSGLWASFQIGTAAIALSVVLGVLVGAIAARRLGGASDSMLMGVALFGIVVPSFVLAPLMSLFLAVNLQWFAVAGWGDGGWRNLTGSIAIEQVFGIDGLGRHFVKGALDRDYPLVMGTVIVYTTFIMIFNLLADLLYAVLDPRIRHASSTK